MSQWRWRWALLGLSALLVASIIFLTVGQRARLTWPEVALREVMAPLQSGVTRVSNGISHVVEGVVRIGRLEKENGELKAEVARLQAELAAAMEAMRENESLRSILQVTKAQYKEVAVAEVIARNPNSWFNTLTINKGAAAGIRKDMAVVTADGLVGRIFTVTNHTAEVLLITDPRSSVGGRIFRTNAVVLADGVGSGSSGGIQVRPLDRETDIRVGDIVVTAGLSEIFPKGIKIGVIEKVRDAQYGLTRYGDVRAAVNFTALEWVAVVTRSQ